jgi:ribonuclease T2
MAQTGVSIRPMLSGVRGVMVMGGTLVRIAWALLFIAAAAEHTLAQTSQGEPGRFDFYVLSLSWSPSFCAAAAERQRERTEAAQCGARPFAFVVHGLWPQYERGFPEYCEVPAPALDHSIIASMLDLMPSPHLVLNEWKRHGTCSGLTPSAYFDEVRAARAEVKIPPEYVGLQQRLDVSPGEVIDAFMAANPLLPRGGIAIVCSRKRLSEVRICLSKELKFRACPQIARHGCTREHVLMPPLRGGG